MSPKLKLPILLNKHIPSKAADPLTLLTGKACNQWHKKSSTLLARTVLTSGVNSINTLGQALTLLAPAQRYSQPPEWSLAVSIPLLPISVYAMQEVHNFQ